MTSEWAGWQCSDIATGWICEMGVFDDTWIECAGSRADNQKIMTVDVNLN
jgi:hypothetical protein